VTGVRVSPSLVSARVSRPLGDMLVALLLVKGAGEPATWRVTVATQHGASYLYPEPRSAAAAVSQLCPDHDRRVLLAGRRGRRCGA
jgi:hypothetical protein